MQEKKFLDNFIAACNALHYIRLETCFFFFFVTFFFLQYQISFYPVFSVKVLVEDKGFLGITHM